MLRVVTEAECSLCEIDTKYGVTCINISDRAVLWFNESEEDIRREGVAVWQYGSVAETTPVRVTPAVTTHTEGRRRRMVLLFLFPTLT